MIGALKLTPKQIEQLFGTWDGVFIYGGKPMKDPAKCDMLNWVVNTLHYRLASVRLTREAVKNFRAKVLAAAYPTDTRLTLFSNATLTVHEALPIITKLAEIARTHYEATGVQADYDFWQHDIDGRNTQIGAMRDLLDCYTPTFQLKHLSEALSQLDDAHTASHTAEERDQKTKKIINTFKNNKKSIHNWNLKMAEKADLHQVDFRYHRM